MCTCLATGQFQVSVWAGPHANTCLVVRSGVQQQDLGPTLGDLDVSIYLHVFRGQLQGHAWFWKPVSGTKASRCRDLAVSDILGTHGAAL